MNNQFQQLMLYPNSNIINLLKKAKFLLIVFIYEKKAILIFSMEE